MRPHMQFSDEGVQEFVTRLFVPEFFSSALSHHCEEMYYAEEAVMDLHIDHEEDDAEDSEDEYIATPREANVQSVEYCAAERQCERSRSVSMDIQSIEEDVQDTSNDPVDSSLASIREDMKMLTAPLSNLNQARLHMQSLLRGFEIEVRKVQPSDLQMLENCLLLPEPVTLPTTFCPVEPDISTTDDDHTTLEQVACGESVTADCINADFHIALERCSFALQNFKMVVNAFHHEEKFNALLDSHRFVELANSNDMRLREPAGGAVLSQEKAQATMREAEERFAAILQRSQAEAHDDLCIVESHDDLCIVEADRLIEEELDREDHSNIQVDQLIAEELSNAEKTWVAGSPAVAARKMRRSSSYLHKADDVKPATSAKPRPAMFLDLALVEQSASSQKIPSARAPRSTRLQNSARQSSIGAPKVSKKSDSEALRPLVISKSAGMIPSIASFRSSKDPLAWDLGPVSGRSKRSRQPLLASAGFSMYSEFR